MMRRLLAVAVLTVGLVACSSSGDSSTPGTERSTTTTTRATTTTVAYTPTAGDFSVEIIETERACFGSAGCSVTFTINPTYLNAKLPDPSKTYTVVYNVNGAEGTKTGSFTLTGGQVQFRQEDMVSTAADTPLTATVVRVLEQ